jgi:hypothetical protein
VQGFTKSNVLTHGSVSTQPAPGTGPYVFNNEFFLFTIIKKSNGSIPERRPACPVLRAELEKAPGNAHAGAEIPCQRHWKQRGCQSFRFETRFTIEVRPIFSSFSYEDQIQLLPFLVSFMKYSSLVFILLKYLAYCASIFFV